MATRFVSSGGSNTSPYETWAKAATSLQTALTAASTAGDIVVLQYNAVPSGDKELAADTVYTFAGHIALVSASADDAATAYTLRPMAADSDWIGNSTTNRYIRLASADLRIRTYGLTFRTAGSTLDQIVTSSTAGSHQVHENTYFWCDNSGAGAQIQLGLVAGTYTKLINPTFRFGATGGFVDCYGHIDIEGGSISASGSTPTVLLNFTTGQADVVITGADFSLVTGTLVGNVAASSKVFMDRCKLGNGVTKLAAQTTNPTKGSPELYLQDCAYGDIQGFFGYYDAQGQVETNTTVYKTVNTTGNRSWKIDTTANCSYLTPFVTPPIDVYHTGTSAITPYLEALHDDAGELRNNYIWAEFHAKTTSGYCLATSYNDSQTLAAFLAGTTGAEHDAGIGVAGWTGEAGTATSYKIDSGSAFTPAEAGSITVNICVGFPSTTNYYVDPEIRGL